MQRYTSIVDVIRKYYTKAKTKRVQYGSRFLDKYSPFGRNRPIYITTIDCTWASNCGVNGVIVENCKRERRTRKIRGEKISLITRDRAYRDRYIYIYTHETLSLGRHIGLNGTIKRRLERGICQSVAIATNANDLASIVARQWGDREIKVNRLWDDSIKLIPVLTARAARVSTMFSAIQDILLREKCLKFFSRCIIFSVLFRCFAIISFCKMEKYRSRNIVVIFSKIFEKFRACSSFCYYFKIEKLDKYYLRT